jgi:ligand-binding sensor domain-containing protein
MSLMRDREGGIWVGTMTSGINRLDPETDANQVFRHDPANPGSLSANGIMAMFEDSAGQVWIGTFGGGISRYDPATEKIARFNADVENPMSLSSDRVTSFAEDRHGQIWVGTEGGGLNLFDPTCSTRKQRVFITSVTTPRIRRRSRLTLCIRSTSMLQALSG